MRFWWVLGLCSVLGAEAQKWSDAQGGAPWDGDAGTKRPWHPIDVIEDEAALEVDAFSSRYMEQRVPAVFRDWTATRPRVASWTLARLKERCGDVQVRFSDRHLAFIETSSPAEIESTRERLKLVEGITLEEAVRQLSRKMSLGEYIDYVLAESAKPRNPLKDYSHLADYILPLKIKELPLEEACKEMFDDVVVPKYFGGRKLDPPRDVCDMLHVRCVHVACTPHVPCMHVACVPHVHVWVHVWLGQGGPLCLSLAASHPNPLHRAGILSRLPYPRARQDGPTCMHACTRMHPCICARTQARWTKTC